MHDNNLVYWTVVYDNNPEQVFYYVDKSKLLANVESSLHGYNLEDNEIVTESIEKCMEKIKEYFNMPCIPILFGSMQIVINRWSMDKTCPIHQVLLEAYDKTTDDDLKAKIDKLFNNYQPDSPGCSS
jgi:hypothetical protein